jgi:hypothetical protein
MSVRTIKGSLMVALCAAAVAIFAVPAQAAPNDPLFLLRPISLFKRKPAPPPSSTFEGPCGLAVDATPDGEGKNYSRVFVSDYYHDFIDIFGANINSDHDNGGSDPRYGYSGQIADTDPYDGPCGIALDAADNLYVNEYHRSVIKVGTGVITGAPLDDERPTGVAVDPVSERLYVNDRDHIAVFDLAGAPLGQIGAGSLIDSYGLAVSRHSTTLGYIYAPDAASNTVKVYAPTPGGTTPVATIDGSETPLGGFVSLIDAAVAVDDATGEVYVVDNLDPEFAEKPEAVVYVFAKDGTYEGRLKYSVVFGQSVGIAVDNSGKENQSRVYVTSGNTEAAAIYAYPPGAAAEEAYPLPEPKNIEPPDETTTEVTPPPGSGTGAVASSAAAPAAAAFSVGTPTPAAAAGSGTKAKKAKKRHRRAKHRAGRIKKGS